MDAIYRIDVFANGIRQGSGPIKGVLSWSSEEKLGELGEFSCAIIATDEQIAEIVPYRTLVCYAFVRGSGFIRIGGGEIRDIETSIDQDNKTVIKVSGPNDLLPLTERSVGYLELATNDGKPITLTAALSNISGYITGWKIVNQTGLETEIFFEFSGETVLAALAKIAELTETHFVIAPNNTIIFKSNDNFDDCGVRAIAVPPTPDPSDPYTCYIVGTPTIKEETRDLFTHIFPYGYGRAEASISLEKSTMTAPDGFVVDRDSKRIGGNYIANTALAAKIGREIHKFRKYLDIELVLPDGIDDKDTSNNYTFPNRDAVIKQAQISAANTLFLAALKDLKDAATRNISFDLSLLHLDNIVRPGQKIRCVFSYRHGLDWIKVDRYLNITAVKLTVDADGIRTTDLTVSNMARPPRLDADPLLKLIAWQNRLG